MGMPIEAVWRRIERRYEDLTPQMRKAARYVRGNPQDVALNSLRALARLPPDHAGPGASRTSGGRPP